MQKLRILFFITIIIVGCKKLPISESDNPSQQEVGNREEITTLQKEQYIINKEALTIVERYPAPEGYTQVVPEANSFGEFLINQQLKPYGEKVVYYNGLEKVNTGVYDSVIDVEIGDRDLHQCADAIMLLRAEYLYSQGRFDEISFNFVSGFKAQYDKWVEGYRIKVDGNEVSYYKAGETSDSYDDFRKYMTMVMAYASTLSLEKELKKIDVEAMEIGDVFIRGGSPGHGIIIVDMATNLDGEKIFLLAQSYMPAQQTQILINPEDKGLSPWFSLKGKEKLITPEWRFDLDELKRF